MIIFDADPSAVQPTYNPKDLQVVPLKYFRVESLIEVSNRQILEKYILQSVFLLFFLNFNFD